MRTPGFSIVAILVLAAACASHQPTRGRQAVDFVEMDGDSAIRFEGVIDEATVNRRGSSLGRWITGSEYTFTLFMRPYGVAWDGTALVITDPDAARVVRVDARGKVALSSPGQFLSPIGVAVCGDGIVVTDSRVGTVTRMDRNLRSPEILAEGLDRPTGVTCQSGRAFVAETGRHRIVLMPTGAAESPSDAEASEGFWGQRGQRPGDFNFPTTVIAGAGSLWIGDTMNFRVQEFDARTGTHVRSFGALGDNPGDMPRIKGVAVDSSGHLWVSDAHLDQVALYRPDGTFLLHLGEFSFPAGIAAHADGRVAVVDSLNRRIQIFRVSPQAGTVSR